MIEEFKKKKADVVNEFFGHSDEILLGFDEGLPVVWDTTGMSDLEIEEGQKKVKRKQ